MKNAEKVLEKIKKKGIKPIPKWHFVLKNTLFWVLFLASIKLGSMAFAIILLAVSSTDFEVISHITDSKGEFILGLLPLLWIGGLFLFLFSSFEGFKKTKLGYKYTPTQVIGSSFGLSILLGLGFFFTGGAEKLEQKFADKMPRYESLSEKRIKRWSMPESGFLAGEIQEVTDESIIIQDLNGKEWAIITKRAIIRPRVKQVSGEKIKIMGRMLEEGRFVAKEIRPWRKKGGSGRGYGKRESGMDMDFRRHSERMKRDKIYRERH